MKYKNFHNYSMVEDLAIGDGFITDKNERFVLDGIQLLEALKDLELCEERIIALINNSALRMSTRNDDIFREFDNANYQRIKINDIVSTIHLHAHKIEYSEENLKDYMDSTKKNMYIDNVTIPKNILVSDFIPNFKFRITNLGFNGLKKSDLVTVSLSNKSLENKTELEFNLPENITLIGNSLDVDVINLECPKRQYEYDLKISITSEEKVIYSTIIQGINIVDRSRYYALQEI